MNFNEKLIELRKSNGLSQDDLGEKLQVSRQSISKWETGQSYPDFEKQVAEIYDDIQKVKSIGKSMLNSKTVILGQKIIVGLGLFIGVVTILGFVLVLLGVR